MQKSLFFRRVLLLLLMALLLWTVLTAVIYGLISRPVFTRIKVDELRPKAESVASIAAAGFIQQDPYLDSLLSSAFEFFDAWVFVIDGLSGEIRSSSLPQSTASEQEIHQLLEQNSPQILSGDYTSIWFTRKIQSGEMLFIGVPVSVSFGRQNSVVGAVYFVRPLEELNAGLRSLNIALLGASLLVLLIMILPTYLATVHLIRPLRQTRDVALAMAEGNFTVRADTRMHGEIGELATTMNQLAAQLDQSISALTLERNRLRQIIEGMGEGLIAVDPDRSITRMNRAATRLLMIPDSDLAQSDGLTATVFSSYPELEQAISRVLSDGDPLIHIVHQPDEKLIEIQIARLPDSRDETAGAVALLRDITESERLEQTRREYVANISHELRTPLTAIRGLLEPLSDGMVSDETTRRRYYGILLRETARLSHLIDDMLELSRLQAHAQPIEMSRLRLQDLLPDLEMKYRSQAEDNELELVMPDQLDQCPPVSGNAARIEQVLVILIDNAIKFTPAGGRVSLELSWDQELVWMTVRDTGIGIDPRDIDHVFDRFYKADKAHQQPGTGLGLSIAREILSRMKQTITVSSVPDQGTAFTFSLSRFY